MSLSMKRNLWIIGGVLLIFFIKITIIVPYVNILLAVLCFIKAYRVNEEIKENE
ncbi:hypothetical protein QYB59_001504 [Clostridium perfringens]|nr:hypothetical protein [Clostridium perfringens]